MGRSTSPLTLAHGEVRAMTALASTRKHSRSRSRSGSPRPSGEDVCGLNANECRKRIEKCKLLASTTKELHNLQNTFDAQVEAQVVGQMRNHDAAKTAPLEAEVVMLRTELSQVKCNLSAVRSLNMNLEKRQLDLLFDKARLATEVSELRIIETAKAHSDAARARDDRHLLMDRRRVEESWARKVDELEKKLVLADRRVVRAEALVQAAEDAEVNAKQDADSAKAERDELTEDLLVVEKEADDAKASLLLAEKREERAKCKLATLQERQNQLAVTLSAVRSSEDWALLQRDAGYKAHQREQARFDAILTTHAFLPKDMARVLHKRGLLVQLFDTPDGADIYFERLQERINHISSVEYGMPLAMYMHYQLKIPIPQILHIDQAASKKFKEVDKRYESKILYSHPFKKGVIIKVPRITPPYGKMVSATASINATLGIETGENGAVSHRHVKVAFEQMVETGVGKHGMPTLSTFAGGECDVPIVFQWDATGYKKQQLTTAAARNPYSPHSAELLEVWAVGNVGDDKGGSTKLMGEQNINTINEMIAGNACLDCNINGEAVLLKPKPYFTLDLACLRHTEHIANSGFCGCARDFALRTTPKKPSTMQEMRMLLSKCKSMTGSERFVLSHMPRPGQKLPDPCTAPGCTFGHGSEEKVQAEWAALLAEEKLLAAVLTKTGKAAFSAWRMAFARKHFNIQPGEYGAPFFHYDLNDFILDLLHMAELGIPKTPWKHGVLNNCSDEARVTISDYLSSIKHSLDTKRKDDGKSRVDKWFSGEKFASFCRGDKGSPGGPIAIATCVKIIADDMQMRGVTVGSGSAETPDPVPTPPPAKPLTGKAAKAAKAATLLANAPPPATGHAAPQIAERAKLTHVPSAMEMAADPDDIKIIRDIYGSRAQTIINSLLAWDAFFAWYYPLKNHSLKLFDTDTEKVEERALANCRSAIDMHESFERLTMSGKTGHKSFLPHGAIYKLTKDILKVGDSSAFSVSALELQNAETKRTGEQGGARNIELRDSGFKRVPSKAGGMKVVETKGYGTTMSLSILRKLLGKRLLQLGDGLLRMPLMRRAQRLFGWDGVGRTKQKSEGKHALIASERDYMPSCDTCVKAFVRSMASGVSDLDHE